MFLGLHTSAELALTTPPQYCCNCGKKRPTDYVETPLKKVRYFLFFGTELTLNEAFPYCKTCKRSAARLRSGFMVQMLIACMVIAALFLGLIFIADSMPKIISDNMFYSSCILGAAITWAYFYLRKKRRSNGSTYYQPVELIDVDLHEEGLSHLHLRFYNKQYAKIFSVANAELIQAGILQLEVAPKHKG